MEYVLLKIRSVARMYWEFGAQTHLDNGFVPSLNSKINPKIIAKTLKGLKSSLGNLLSCLIWAVLIFLITKSPQTIY